MQIQKIGRVDKREIRYRRGPSLVRNMRAVRKTSFCGTRRIFRGIRCAEQASVVRKRYSVPETPSYGTGCIFIRRHSVPERAFSGTEYARGAKNRLLWYAAHFQGHSVRRTGFSGTEGIFGTGNHLLRYGVHLHSEAFGTGNALLRYGVHLQRA